MSTRNILIRRLPRLERLLLDGDIDPELADYLRAVGFDVILAPRDDDLIRDDVEVLRYARRRSRILVCHDKHRDIETQMRLFPEIYYNGGRILRITGDSSQSCVRALGKVTVHYDEWSEWFRTNPQGGRVVVDSKKWSKTTAEEFMERHLHRVYAGEEVPPLPPKRRGRRGRATSSAPIEQRPMNL